MMKHLSYFLFSSFIIVISCERQEFRETNTDWEAYLSLKGKVYTICDNGDTTISDAGTVDGNNGKLKFHKDGSGITDKAINIFTDSTFTWSSVEDTLTLTLTQDSLAQYNLVLVLVQDGSIKGKMYKIISWAYGLPCYVDYSVSDSYMYIYKE